MGIMGLMGRMGVPEKAERSFTATLRSKLKTTNKRNKSFSLLYLRLVKTTCCLI